MISAISAICMIGSPDNWLDIILIISLSSSVTSSSSVSNGQSQVIRVKWISFIVQELSTCPSIN